MRIITYNLAVLLWPIVGLADGVNLGLAVGTTEETLLQARPSLVRLPINLTSGEERSVLVDPSLVKTERTSTMFYFVSKKLFGISRTQPFSSQLLKEIASEVAQGVHSKQMKRLQDMEIVRVNGIEAGSVIAMHWANPTEAMDVYVVVTKSQITTVCFDPQKLSSEHFFVSGDQIERVRASSQAIKEKFQSRKTHDVPVDMSESFEAELLTASSSSGFDASTYAGRHIHLFTSNNKPKLQTKHSSKVLSDIKPTSSKPWSIIVVLIMAALGLLWLLLKRRS